MRWLAPSTPDNARPAGRDRRAPLWHSTALRLWGTSTGGRAPISTPSGTAHPPQNRTRPSLHTAKTINDIGSPGSPRGNADLHEFVDGAVVQEYLEAFRVLGQLAVDVGWQEDVLAVRRLHGTQAFVVPAVFAALMQCQAVGHLQFDDTNISGTKKNVSERFYRE